MRTQNQNLRGKIKTIEQLQEIGRRDQPFTGLGADGKKVSLGPYHQWRYARIKLGWLKPAKRTRAGKRRSK